MVRNSQAGRREFLLSALGGTACGRAASEGPSKVVVARGASGAAALLDKAMLACFDCDSPVEAWKRVVRPGEVVGLKVNCLAGRGASTSVALVEAVAERLQQAGVAARNIIVWDRLAADLEHGGFRPGSRRGGIRYIGNDEAGYEDELAAFGSAGSLLARTLTRTCDAVINLPVLKDHGIVGVTMALKNMFGAIHNPNKYHLNTGDPYVADVYMLPGIRQKTRLAICDALIAQYEGGPSYMPQWSWPFNGLLVSRDPVALDAVGWRILEDKRAEKGMKTLKAAGREPNYIRTAAGANHRIGVCDLERIRRVDV